MMTPAILYFPAAALMLSCILLIQGSCSTSSDSNSNPAPGYYQWKSASQEIRLPFELFAGNKPMIRGHIGDKEVRFLIDNGKLWNETWFYNGEVDSIGLHYASHRADSVKGIGEEEANQIFEGEHISVDFGDIIFHGQPTLISPPEAGYADFFPGINGQVSAMLFRHFVVQFDFKRMIITLIRPGDFTIPPGSEAIRMEHRANGSYCIPFELLTREGSTHEVLLDIDLGTVFPLYLISNSQNHIPVSPSARKQFLGLGASGEIHGYNDTLAELRFASFSFRDYPALIVPSSSNADTDIVENGTFGIELMKNFTVTFDYIHELIYFETVKID